MAPLGARALKYLAKALGPVPERKAVVGPPVILSPEDFKGLWDLVEKRFATPPEGDTESELGDVWFKATGTESGSRSENDWPNVRAAIDGRELSGPLQDATIEFEQFTSKPGGAKNRRVIYVRLLEDSDSEIEVVGPHDWKVATIADIRTYLATCRSFGRRRRWLLILASFLSIFAVITRLATPGAFGWDGALIGIGVISVFVTMPIAVGAFYYVPVSRMYLDSRTQAEPTWYRYLGIIAGAVATTLIAGLVVSYFTGL
jgi:hypothetical protein